MRIAIDFDGTYSEDPGLWASFADQAKGRGHLVVVVTCADGDRYLDIREVVDVNLPVVFTSGAPKKTQLEEMGWPVDVWIDDDPDTVTRGM